MDPTGLTAIASLLTALKALVGMAKDVNDTEFNDKLIDIQQKVLDIQSKFAELQDDNFNLKQQLRTLQQSIATKANLFFERSVYWRWVTVTCAERDDEGNIQTREEKEGPFCPACQDMDGKLVRLKELDTDTYSGVLKTRYTCILHKTRFYLPAVAGTF